MASSALLVIDVQNDLFAGPDPAHEGDAVLVRIADLAARARTAGVPVIYVQHDGEEGGEVVALGSHGWEIHDAVRPQEGDLVVHKTASDGFHLTNLKQTLAGLGVERVYVAGFATQFCVDATSRRATSEGYDVVLVADAHTTYADLEGAAVSAAEIVAHHNATLPNLAYRDHSVVVTPAAEIDFAAAGAAA